jgi:Flp pilus assembly protein TadG
MTRACRPTGRWSRADSQRGATAVEFALIVPVFFALVFGTIEMALTFQHQSALNSAANSAARAASLGTPSSIVANAQTAAMRTSGAMKAGDYMYIYNPDTTGDPVGAVENNPCPRESCDEFTYDGTKFVGYNYTYSVSSQPITNYGTFSTWSSCDSKKTTCTFNKTTYSGYDATSNSLRPVSSSSTYYTHISTTAQRSTIYTTNFLQGTTVVSTQTTTVIEQCTAYRTGSSTFTYFLDTGSCQNISGSFTPPSSSQEFDPSKLSASDGCAIGIYLSSDQNWITGGDKLAGLGPSLELQAQKVASLTSTSTSSYWGSTSSTCGQATATKRKYNHHRNRD